MTGHTRRPDGPERARCEVARVAALAETRRTTGEGCGIAWHIWGEGPPLLLLHGNFGSWMHWIRNINALSRRFRLFVPDLPGFGASDTPPEGADAFELGRIMCAAWDALEQPGRPAVVGFSLGCTVAGAMARQLGPGAEHFVMVSAGQVGARRQEIPRMASWRKAPDAAARNAAHAENLRLMMLCASSSVDDLAIHVQAENAPRVRIDTRPVTASHPLRGMLFDLDCPISGIWGMRDPTIGPYMQDRRDLMAELWRPNAIRVIEDAGHWVQYERPAAFHASLASLLENP